MVDDPRAYLFTVAANLVLDRQRRRQRAAVDGWLAQHALQEPLAPDVADVHAHRQALRAVVQGLDGLPARARNCFLAHRLDGVGHDELAQHHGVSVKTIERDVKLAMDRVRAVIEHWHGPSPGGVQRPGRRRALSALLGVTGLGGTGLAGLAAWRASSGETQLASAVGRGAQHTLPDGSVLTLDADSRARCRFDPLQRHVRLEQGSAFFAVQREHGWRARPFTVQALDTLVTVLGTRFGVEIDDGTVRVEVAEGLVGVRGPDGQDRRLAAGQSAQLRPGGPVVLQRQAADSAAAWRHGWLDFFHLPLARSVARLARYSTRRLQVAPDAASLPVLGRVHTGSVDEWLRLLPRYLPVRLQTQPDGSLLIRRR